MKKYHFRSAILKDILTALNTPENLQKLTETKERSGNEMLKIMQFVFPVVIQIEMDVIKNYGFPEGREGAWTKSTWIKINLIKVELKD